ncbi:choice-of-anchor B family protein [Colwelliaceae bacterium BS250]
MTFIDKPLLIILIITGLVFNSNLVMAHAEHDKVRYVAVNGVDTGRCENVGSPCKTIDYAAQHANKGDEIRLSKGSYHIESVDTLFYLLSDLIPIIGNYQQQDNYQNKSAENTTFLTGVPVAYTQQLSAKGFTVIVDNKPTAKTTNNKNILAAKLASFNRLQEKQIDVPCVTGFAGDHQCNNIDLLAHIPLNQFELNPEEANDIWGHYDLNTGKEYALIGFNNGIGIVDTTIPTAPQIVTTIASANTIWRDIKVYQYFDLAMNKWQSYAYVTADNANVGLLILDLNQLPNSASIVANDQTDLSAHNVYLSNVDYSTGVAINNKPAYLHIAGSNRNGGGFNTYSLIEPTSLSAIYKPPTDRNQYSHDVSSMIITDDRKDDQCVNATDHCEVMFDFNENDFQLWDKTQNDSPEKLSTTSYLNAAYVHSGWYSENKLLMLVHDELDEQNFGLNTTLRLFDITNLTKPTLLSIWTGDTKAIDHNGFVRGNRYYMSNYERGITVLDISDPTQPQEVGFFDTYPIANNPSFNGAWGVYPFLPSGHILASDINSGLYILKDRTLDVVQGSISFSSRNYAGSEGQTTTINVKRNNQAQGAIAVEWELVTGSANSDDFNITQGTLTWADNDNTDKLLTVDILEDNIAESEELLFVRLFNPQHGATLQQPNLATITITSSNGENVPQVSAGNNITVNSGTEVNLQATAEDLDGDSLTYLWQQQAGVTVTITNSDQLNAKFTAPATNDVLSFSFTATDPSNLSATDHVNIEIEIEVITIVPEKIDNSGGSLYYSPLFLLLILLKRLKTAHKNINRKKTSNL